MSAAERAPLPNTSASPSPSSLSRRTLSASSSLTSVAFAHSAVSSVREQTIFAIPFIRPATSPFADGQ